MKPRRPGSRKRRDRSGSLGALRRPRPYREPRARVLIVCEGSKTEPAYFHGLLHAKRLATTKIEVVGGQQAGGTHPKRLVEHAKHRHDEARREGDEYDEVWCVFDRDEHARIDEAFVQAKDNGFHIAFTNPSFELWYLLHYRWQGAEIDRRAVVRELKACHPSYHKSDDMYGELLLRQRQAIDYARELRKQHKLNADACVTESPNPSTWVDKLVEYLNAIE